MFQVLVKTPIEQDEKSESDGIEHLSFASPAVAGLTRRIIQPISRIREGATEHLQAGVSGIIVAVEAKIRADVLRQARTIQNQKLKA